MNLGVAIQEDGETSVEIISPEKLLEQISVLEQQVPDLKIAADQAQRVASDARTNCEQRAEEVRQTAATADAARNAYERFKSSRTPIDKGVLEGARTECVQSASASTDAKEALDTAKSAVEAAEKAAAKAKASFDEAVVDLDAKQQFAEAAREALREKQERLNLLRQAAVDARAAAENSAGAKAAAEATQQAVGRLDQKVDNLTQKVDVIDRKVDGIAPKKRKIAIVVFS